MKNGELIFALVIAALVIVGCLLGFFISMQAKPCAEPSRTNEPPRPRIVLPTESNIYTFSLDSQLKPEEWQLILNAGWSFLTCTTEQYVDYAGCYPGAPKYHRTRWNYVFRRQGGSVRYGKDG